MTAFPSPVVFFGTSDFAVPVFSELASRTEVTLVVTQPDRPAGRGRKLTPPPVKRAAIERAIALVQPERIKAVEFVERIAAERPRAIVVVSYGKILGPAILGIPPLGCINVHASLLPKYRGAAPIQRSILNGEARTGVSVMRMDEGLDTGPILAQDAVDIDPNETAGDLSRRLSELGARTLVLTLERMETIAPMTQDPALATQAAKITKEDCVVDWTLPAFGVHNRIRALSPEPGAFTFLGDERLILLRSRVIGADHHQDPGGIVRAGKNELFVACGSDLVQVLELKPAGRRPMSGGEYLAGRRGTDGARMTGPGNRSA